MDWSINFIVTSVLLGVGLAMDAFSVSLANGLNEPIMKKGKMFGVSGVFGFFQFAMPTNSIVTYSLYVPASLVATFRRKFEEFDFASCLYCGHCELFEENQEDCIGNTHPACGGCLWAEGVLSCP